jgi:large subunit ribosomal protein L23
MSEATSKMPHQVLIRPLVTEKGIHRAQRYNHYAFEVAPDATKIDVRKAVEEHFNVKVEKVAIQNRRGKSRRFRFRLGETQRWKKAVVKLSGDYKIDFF